MTTVQAVLRELIDDAALFPPASESMPAAVIAHRLQHAGPYAELVGRFVCPASRIGELREVLDVGADPHHPMAGLSGGSPLRVSLIADTGPVGLPRAMADLAADPRIVLEAVEVPPVEGSGRAAVTDALAGIQTALPTYLELPAQRWQPTVDALAAIGRGAKLRLGGPRVPSVAEVAEVLAACARRGVPVKATAGLHHAVTDGREHGFLNVLVAAAAAVRHADPVPALSERDGARLAAEIGHLDPAVRRLFVGFGCCAVADPIDDLRKLGLV